MGLMAYITLSSRLNSLNELDDHVLEAGHIPDLSDEEKGQKIRCDYKEGYGCAHKYVFIE